jgi:hypothetical protein
MVEDGASPGSGKVTDPDLGHKDAEKTLELQAVEKKSQTHSNCEGKWN